ncbi:hypothetical protein KUCAC02_028800, partial [Chaenocephalus aceratus]
HCVPLPSRTLCPPAQQDTVSPCPAGHCVPLPSRTLCPPAQQDTVSPCPAGHAALSSLSLRSSGSSMQTEGPASVSQLQERRPLRLSGCACIHRHQCVLVQILKAKCSDGDASSWLIYHFLRPGGGPAQGRGGQNEVMVTRTWPAGRAPIPQPRAL